MSTLYFFASSISILIMILSGCSDAQIISYSILLAAWSISSTLKDIDKSNKNSLK